jgi:hypothetical protein
MSGLCKPDRELVVLLQSRMSMDRHASECLLLMYLTISRSKSWLVSAWLSELHHLNMLIVSR